MKLAKLKAKEVLKAALPYNAAADILFQNHLSFHLAPSDLDRRITQWHKEALGLV